MPSDCMPAACLVHKTMSSWERWLVVVPAMVLFFVQLSAVHATHIVIGISTGHCGTTALSKRQQYQRLKHVIISEERKWLLVRNVPELLWPSA